VLELRPHRVEALLETARQLAHHGDFEAAEKLTARALELDPEHRAALRNLTRYRFYSGQIGAGTESLIALEAEGLFDEKFALALAGRLFLSGQAREAMVVLTRLSPDWETLDGDLAWVEADKQKAAGNDLLKDAFESYAHWMWAREQAVAGNPSRAIAVYRQNLRITRDYVEDGPTRVRMELCAAQWLAKKPESAAETAARLTPRATDWASLPDWAGEALRESQLFP
jgi:tetratricopeptide (TPR) repeat protein